MLNLYPDDHNKLGALQLNTNFTWNEKFTLKWKYCHHLVTLKLFQNLYEFFFCWAQNTILWRMLVSKQLIVAIDFHNMENKILSIDTSFLVKNTLLKCAGESIKIRPGCPANDALERFVDALTKIECLSCI